MLLSYLDVYLLLIKLEKSTICITELEKWKEKDVFYFCCRIKLTIVTITFRKIIFEYRRLPAIYAREMIGYVIIVFIYILPTSFRIRKIVVLKRTKRTRTERP